MEQFYLHKIKELFFDMFLKHTKSSVQLIKIMFTKQDII